jgi:membrane-associated phospholipid phosphatase
MANRAPASPRARVALLIALPAALWYGVLVGAGLLLTGPAAGLAEEGEDVVEALQASRSPLLDDVTHWISWTANTASIVLGAFLIGLLLRALWRLWLPTLMLWAGVAMQSGVFLLTTLVVSRRRPDVEQLDPAPPTSGFPSGHAGAATALWLGLGLLLAHRIGRRWPRVLLVVLLVLVPLAVGVARLYRGMHFPGDVLFGLLNGLAAVLIVRHALAGDPTTAPPAGAPATAERR